MQIKTTSFIAAESAIRRVRDSVFGDEQSVPRDIDWDGVDSQCIHVLVQDESGTPIGTGRLASDGKIGRMAVLTDWRGQGVGTAMLEALTRVAQAQGLTMVYLHAQAHAIAFYENRGFRQEGAQFMEANIPHVKMIRESV